jgi:RNA polymerase sigma-70 factor (ECF subfamily)
MPSDPDDLAPLRDRVQAGDHHALGELFGRHRGRLLKMVQLRLDRRLRGRLDPEDVVQEAFLDAARRLGDYAADPRMPPFLWLRFLTIQRLQTLHRLHLGVQGRDASREVSILNGSLPAADSRSLAAQLLGRLTTPSRAAIRAEIQTKIQEALNAMDPVDREILALRHFEELNNGETAAVLGIQKAAASNRYVRALRRLREIRLPALGMLDDSGMIPPTKGRLRPRAER